MMIQFDPASTAGDFVTSSLLKVTAVGQKAFVHLKDLSRNAVSPAFLLRRLSQSVDPEQKIAAADHIDTPMAVHMALACDSNPDVRFALAENHNISRDVLNKLTEDSNPYVAHRARKTLARLSLHDSDILCWRTCRTA